MSLAQNSLNNPLIIIAEIGKVLDINNTQEKNLFSEKIKNKESFMYNNDGELITDIDNIFLDNNGNNINKEEKYFIFNKKYVKETTLKMLDESIKEIISNYDSQINLDMKNAPDVYKHYNLLVEKSSLIKYIQVEDIQSTYEKMLEFFENYKVIFTTFKLNSHICEIIKNNYKNQNYSINALINNVNKINEICEKRKNEIINENNKLSEIKENDIKILNEGLEYMKKQELHPILQIDGKKYLIDIYLDIKKMETLKDDLIKKEENLLKYTREKTALHINESNKLVNEKAKSITEIKNDWSNLSLEYDNKYNELIKEPNKLYENLLQDFLFFKQSLLNIIDYLNSYNSQNDISNEKKLSEQEIKMNKAFDESCQQINSLKTKYNDFSSLTQLQSKLEPINEISNKMRKNLENFSLRINKIFNVFFSIQKNLSEISDKFNQIKEKIINLEECFNQLKNPSKFPLAYESALDEIKRRIIFNYRIKNYFQKIGNFVKKEIDLRKQFKSIHGIYLPIESFPCLKYFDLKLKCEINTEDELNKFPKLLSDEEIKLIIENEQNMANNSFDGNILLNSGISETKNPENKNKKEEIFNIQLNTNTEQKIKELYEELNKKDQLIKNLQMQLETSINSIDKICNNFRFILLMKEKEIKQKIKERDNLEQYINNKINNNILSCPLCSETARNNEQFSNINMFLNEMENKITNKDTVLKQLNEKYKDLIIQTTQMKKIFFNHMNLKIANHNLNSKINGGMPSIPTNDNCSPKLSPSDFQILKNIINEEKLKSNNLLTELNLSKAKYDSLICDIKKLESKNEELKIKLNSTNEKLLSKLKENETFKDEILLHEKQKKTNENTLNELRQFIKQINEEKKNIEDKKNKEISKIKNKSIIFKDIKEGDRCIFVPHSENVYACINLTKDLNQLNNTFYRCDILLDFSNFDETKKKLIVEHSLILIGVINELKEVNIKEGEDNPYEINTNSDEGENGEVDEYSGLSTIESIQTILKSSNSYYLAKINNIDYIIGFPGDELIFMNYNNIVNKKLINNS